MARFRAASEANDIAALMETLDSDVELVSPLSGKMLFRGRDDLRTLLTAVYASMSGLRWGYEVGDDTVRVVVGEGFVGPVALGDVMICELGDDGRIRRIRPHLRPWLATSLFALRLAPKIGRHPGVLVRALRRD